MPTITLCKNGHDLELVGTISRGRCRECMRQSTREWRARPEVAARLAEQRRSPETRAYWARWREKNLERARESSRRYMHQRRLRENFGLTVEEYNALVEAQDGRCGICGEAPEGRVLVVDHDHESGEIRGLLCTACNVGIGNLGDSADRLRAAIQWLEGGGQGADD